MWPVNSAFRAVTGPTRKEHSMREFTLVDCETGLIYGPYRTCPMARAHAEAEAIATWEIFTDGDALVDWSCPDPITLPTTRGAVLRHAAA